MKNDRIETAYLSLIAEANIGDGKAKVEELKNKLFAGKIEEILEDDIVQKVLNAIGMTLVAKKSQMKKFESPDSHQVAESAIANEDMYDPDKMNKDMYGFTDLENTNLQMQTLKEIRELRKQLSEMNKDQKSFQERTKAFS